MSFDPRIIADILAADPKNPAGKLLEQMYVVKQDFFISALKSLLTISRLQSACQHRFTVLIAYIEQSDIPTLAREIERLRVEHQTVSDLLSTLSQGSNQIVATVLDLTRQVSEALAREPETKTPIAKVDLPVPQQVIDKYVATMHLHSERRCATHPELPGLIVYGSTPEEVKRVFPDAVKHYLQELFERQETQIGV